MSIDISYGTYFGSDMFTCNLDCLFMHTISKLSHDSVAYHVPTRFVES